MTVCQLIERLDEHFDEFGDGEVRLMTQANYPLEHTVAGAASAEEIGEDDPPNVIYIVEGQQIGYGNERAWGVVR